MKTIILRSTLLILFTLNTIGCTSTSKNSVRISAIKAPPRIAIIGAMEEEIGELQKELVDPKITEISSIKFYTGKLAGKNVVIAKSGVGKVNAALATHIAIDNFSAKKVIFTGVAGGLNPSLNIGDIVVSRDLIQHDLDITVLGYKRGQYSKKIEPAFKASKKLVDLAYKKAKNLFKNRKVIIGRVLSGDQFISSPEKVKELKQSFSGDSVEMEGAALAHVCFLSKVPFVVIRTISDKANEKATIDYPKFFKKVAINSKKIVVSMLKEM